jgi:hypothetical protein
MKFGYFDGLRGRGVEMTLEQAAGAAHQGQCDEDVAALARVPEIAAQLDGFAPEDLAESLREYGAWDAAELADHDANKHRALWMAAWDIIEVERGAANSPFHPNPLP